MMKKKLRVILAMSLAFGMVSGCGRRAPESSSEEKTEAVTESTTEKSEDSEEKETVEFDRDSKDVQDKTKKIEDYIDKYFYFDEDGEKQEESYFDGIMEGLDDPYSCYYTKEEYERMKEDDSGSFSGIGATLQQDVETGVVVVVKPMKGNPAEKAGVLAEDKIVQVDETELTTDMDLDSVVSIIRGPKGSTVHLKIYRDSDKKYHEFDIVRDDIKVDTVEYNKISEANIGYIYVSQFINTTAEDFMAAVDDLQSQGVEALVIDMRSNPGGFVKAATTMADYLVEDDLLADGAEKNGLLLQTKDKNGKVDDEIVCQDGHSVDLPMVVLVNGNTASASEIFTGIMKDYKKATIIGTKTYGKGIVQQVIPLDDGSAIKITIAKYFIPSGTDIHKVGIEPDKVVEYEQIASDTDAATIDDTQEQAALEELTE